jgi:hypothetical protein
MFFARSKDWKIVRRIFSPVFTSVKMKLMAGFMKAG